MSRLSDVTVVMHIAIMLGYAVSGVGCQSRGTIDLAGGRRNAECERVQVQWCSARCLPQECDLSLVVGDENAKLYPGSGSSIPVADVILEEIFSSLCREKSTLIVHLCIQPASASERLPIAVVDRCLQRIERAFANNSTANHRLIIRVFSKTRDASTNTQDGAESPSNVPRGESEVSPIRLSWISAATTRVDRTIGIGMRDNSGDFYPVIGSSFNYGRAGLIDLVRQAGGDSGTVAIDLYLFQEMEQRTTIVELWGAIAALESARRESGVPGTGLDIRIIGRATGSGTPSPITIRVLTGSSTLPATKPSTLPSAR